MFRTRLIFPVVTLLATLTQQLAAQGDCNSQSAGANGGSGFCFVDYPAIFSDAGTQGGGTFVGGGGGGGGPRGINVLPGVLGPLQGPPATILNNGTGTVDQATGAFNYDLGMYYVGGISTGASVYVGARYRSYLATNHTAGSGASQDPTGGLWPFGVGWASSFAGGPLKNATPSDTVGFQYIDSDGVNWQTGPGSTPVTISDPFATASPASGSAYVYPAIKGQRWVYMVGKWFRELPDRTLIEYEQRNDFSSLNAFDVGYRPKRAFKELPGDPNSGPLWEVHYEYNTNSDEIKAIYGLGLRGYRIDFTWEAVSVGVYRITKISASCPARTYTDANYDVHLTYDTAGQLATIRYPRRDIYYRADGAFASSGSYLEKFDQKGYKYTYSGNMLTKVDQELLQTGTSTWTTEQRIANTYASTPSWQVSSQVEGPSTGGRTHSFNYTTPGSPTPVKYTDPESQVHLFVPTADFTSADPKKIFVDTYTIHPGTNARTWNLDYASCTCGAIARITLPSGRKYEFDYDYDERLFVTKIRQISSGGSPSTREWIREYASWGLPWNATNWHGASRLTKAKQEDAKEWLYTFNSTSLSTEVMSPSVGSTVYTWKYIEDDFERVTQVEEPQHTTDGGGTAKKTTTLSYGTNAADPSYGLLVNVATVLAAGTRDVSYTYDNRGRITGIYDEGSTATSVAYDRGDNVVEVTLPATLSGRNGTSAISGVKQNFEYGVHGQVTKSTQTWKSDTGTTHTNPNREAQASYNIYGEIVTERRDAATQATASDLWLTTKHTLDNLGRVTESLNEHNAEGVKVSYDLYGMVDTVQHRISSGSWTTAENYEYNADDQVTLHEDSTSFETRYTYDAHARLESAEVYGTSSTAERKVGYSYTSALGDLPTIATYHLRSAGTLSSILQRTWSRDELGRVTQVASVDQLLVGLAAKTSSVVWNGASRLASRTDENGRTTTYSYDVAGSIKSITDPVGNKSVVTRDIKDRVTTLEQILKKAGSTDQTYATDYSYDDWNRVLVVTRRGNTGISGTNAIRNYGYDSLSNLTYFRDAELRKTDGDYDALGRLRETRRYPSSGSGNTVESIEIFDWGTDALAALSTATTDGFSNTYTATNLSQVVRRKDTKTNATYFIYNGLGQLQERRTPGYTAPSGSHTWSYEYDSEGRLSRWIMGTKHVVKQERNDPLLRVTRRWLETNNPGTPYPKSLMTAGEAWSYDAVVSGKIEYEVTTFKDTWITATSGAADRRLVSEKRSFDAHGLLHSEDFGFADGGSGSTFDGRVSVDTRTISHDWFSGAGVVDTGFRRGLSYESGWDMSFTPDAAAKRSSMDITAPGSSTPWTAATWGYEGNRTSKRDVKLDTVSGSEWFQTTWDVNKHGYLSGITSVFAASTPVTLYDLDQEQDLEGFVTKKKYSKVSGAGGDLFLLDGYGRLAEAKLGVATSQIDMGWSSATTYDKHLTYALDLAQNRTAVTDSSNTLPTGYKVEEDLVGNPISNRYAIVTSGGVDVPFLYDGNGNLIWDGQRYFVYDYLDRICEVWQWTEGTGESSQQAKTSTGTRYAMSSRQMPEMAKYLAERAASRNGLRKDGIQELNQGLARDYAKLKSSSSSTSSSGAPELVLVALYGYDTGNRRCVRYVSGDSEGLRWSTWDGWQQVEEYEDAGTVPYDVRKVWFRGRGLTDTLGFATTDGSAWNRYTLIQGSLGTVVAAYTPTGGLVERYEYDPYGLRYGYKPNGSGGYTSIGGLGAKTTEIEQHDSAAGGRDDWETGLVYLRNRYHNPLVGRFMSRDPLGAWADGANWGNAYGYSGNSPITLHDPEGLTVWDGHDHHQFPQQHWHPTRKNSLPFPDDVREFFDKATVRDPRGASFDTEHRKLNERAGELIEDFLGGGKKNPTRADLERAAKSVKLDDIKKWFHGTYLKDPRITDYLDEISRLSSPKPKSKPTPTSGGAGSPSVPRSAPRWPTCVQTIGGWVSKGAKFVAKKAPWIMVGSIVHGLANGQELFPCVVNNVAGFDILDADGGEAPPPPPSGDDGSGFGPSVEWGSGGGGGGDLWDNNYWHG